MSDNEKYGCDNGLDQSGKDEVETDCEMEIVEYSYETIESIDFADENVAKVDDEAEKPKKKLIYRILLEVWSYVKMLVVAFLLAFFINQVILINATVPTSSMENTIMAKSRMIGLRLSYWLSEPQRGDVVVFKYPLDEKENYVKRLIGLPGERVEIQDGQIYIYKDGLIVEGPLEETYLKEKWVKNGGTSGDKKYVFNVPEDSYLMLGDNRNWSADAREWVSIVEAQPEKYPDSDIIYVKDDKILGKVFFTYWGPDGISFDWIDNSAEYK